MKISYAITVCNELREINTLLRRLLEFKRDEDEICVLLDKPKAPLQLIHLLHGFVASKHITLKESSFEGHFADWKNELMSMCTGDYIINIDADEIPSTDFQESIVEILEENPEVDMFAVPRVNTVEGLTEEHIKKWGWQVSDQGWVNWPDYQMRVYKNVSTIRWINPVHEILNGFQTFAPLPDAMFFHHHKTITKQEKQNELYDTI